jgi:hypothetical protein
MDEPEKIYCAIFKSPIPLPIKERFQRASKDLSAGYTQEELAQHNRAISKVADLEALELVARHTKKLPLLVMKFNLMIYLAETLPENRNFYINRNNALCKGWAFLIFSGLRMIMKLSKGLFLLAKLRI